jgi:hypothetical protein
MGSKFQDADHEIDAECTNYWLELESTRIGAR